MQKYRRVTYEDRCHIAALLQAKFPILEISRRLGYHKSTIEVKCPALFEDVAQYFPKKIAGKYVDAKAPSHLTVAF